MCHSNLTPSASCLEVFYPVGGLFRVLPQVLKRGASDTDIMRVTEGHGEPRAYKWKWQMIENIQHEGVTLAVLLRSTYQAEGIQFFTPDDFSQQLGYMSRSKGYEIPPHVHNPVAREVQFTKEVLFIKSGKVRVDFYDDHQIYLESRILFQGDVLLLAFGGHGFEMLENSEIIEVKQGPYAGDDDKTRFVAVAPELVRICSEQ